MQEIRSGIWWLGNCAWGFGLTERSFAALFDLNLNAIDLILLSTASLCFVGWLFLKPMEGE